MTELQMVAERITRATSYTDIFGQPPTGEAIDDHVKRVYRLLARTVHPDRYTGTASYDTANQAFQRLNVFKDEANKAYESGRFGEPTKLVTITTKHGLHIVTQSLGSGDIAALYETETKIGGVVQTGFCKIAKTKRDNDLLANEAAALKRLHTDTAEDKWKRHVPILLDTFVYDTGRRRANVMQLLEDFYSLEQLLTVYPRGVDPRHGVWMFRRLLMALGFAHDNGIIHGAVVPSHVLIHPANHGVVLGDWCYASIRNDDEQPPIKAIVGTYRALYPEEVLAKQSPSPATDIAMAVRSIIAIMGGSAETGVLPDRVPRPLRSYLKGCLQSKQSMRPQNAWLLLEEFDDLLKQVGPPYYPRRFLEFTVPTGTV